MITEGKLNKVIKETLTSFILNESNIANNNTYIRYGQDDFDMSKFKPIKNQTELLSNKPYGGLWASPIKTEYGWFEFCVEGGFQIQTLMNNAQFNIKKDANIYIIDSKEDLLKLPMEYSKTCPGYKAIDFELMVKQGYDGIFLTSNGQSCTRFGLQNLYGWDIESLLIFNPNIITNITKNVNTGKQVPTAYQNCDKFDIFNDKLIQNISSWQELKTKYDNTKTLQHKQAQTDYDKYTQNVRNSSQTVRNKNFARKEFNDKLNNMASNQYDDYSIKTDSKPLHRKNSLNREL